jgi:hypothetical protein
VQEARLLTPNQPIDWPLDWSAGAVTPNAPLISKGGIFRDYLQHGMHHILVGWDHLLFMAVLVLAVASVWDLILVVTAFTVAHTITLILATLGWVNLPSSIVEPMIAGSIVAVALQNIFAPRQTRGWPRLAVAFGFGLFHGLGFAGGLLDAMQELPGIAMATAIAAFSIGVELGHQVVALPLFGVVMLFRRIDRTAPEGGVVARRVRVLGSVCIGLAGLFYLGAALR